MSNEIIPYSDIEKMGVAIAKSGLFGLKTPEQAVALMLIAQAEGIHPAAAARDYHIIEGRPSLKADAMLSRFISAGGKVEWHDLSDSKVCATFAHPAGGTVTIDWDIARAKKAEVYKEKTSTGKAGMWVKYPRQMLRSRVISEGIRTVYPGVAIGMYTPEEVQDFEPQKSAPKETVAEVVNDHDLDIIALIRDCDDLENLEFILNTIKSTKDKFSNLDEVRKVFTARKLELQDEINRVNAHTEGE